MKSWRQHGYHMGYATGFYMGVVVTVLAELVVYVILRELT